VTPSITVPQASIWEKLNVYDQIVIKNPKGEEMDSKQIIT